MLADNENLIDEKRSFAELWLKFPNDPFKAAGMLFPTNNAKALWTAVNWVKDPEVLQAKFDLRETEGESSFLPSKNELSRDIWEKMQCCGDPEAYAKLAKLYADVRGFIEKPAMTQNNIQVIAPKVIQVTNHGSDSDWEKAAIMQQTESLNVSRNKY